MTDSVKKKSRTVKKGKKNKTRIEITSGFILILSVMFYFSRADTFISMLAAALCHEMGHLAAIGIMGGSVRKITLSVTGAAIFVGRLSYPEEVVCAAAGPAASIFCAVLGALAAKAAGLDALFAFSGMSLINGVLNAVPAAELDGGRVLRVILFWRYGENNSSALRIIRASGLVCSICIIAAGAYVLLTSGHNVSLLITGLWMLFMCVQPGISKEKILGIA